MNKKIWICLLMSLMLVGCKEEVKKVDPVRPVRTFKISGKLNPEKRSFPGKVKATREATLAFRIPGQVIKFTVKEGDEVKKGQLIALLDQRDYQAAVADLRAKLAGARSVLNEARLNIERNKKLLASNIIAQSDYDTVTSTFETSRASVLSLEQSLRRSELNLQYTRLEAPFAGTIAVKEIDNHEYVQAKEAIVQLEDTSSLDVVLDLPESFWAKAFGSGKSPIRSAVAQFEALPERTFPLTMKEFQTKANPQTQTYEVTLNMINPEGLGIHPGMTAEVMGNLPKSNSAKTVNIPFSAVVGVPGGPKFVWVLDKDNIVNKREITVGQIMNDMFIVHSGVSKGETIVVSGVNYLREGQSVTVLKGRIGGRG